MAKKNLVLQSRNGGVLELNANMPRYEPDYLQWSTAHGMAFGVVKNSPALRLFLRRALVRLEKDAARRGEGESQ